MSQSFTKVVVNCTTGEEQMVPMTAEEIAQWEADAIEYAAKKEAEEAAAQAKAEAKESGIAKLLALGLTEEEANALVK